MLKAVQIAYYEKQEFLTVGKQYILQSTSRRLLSYIQTARKRVVSDKKYSEKRLDILSGLVLAANALNGPPTRERLLIAQFGLSIANRQKTFKVFFLFKRLNESFKTLGDICIFRNSS